MKSAPDVLEKARGPGSGRAKFRLGDIEVRPRSGVISGPGGERKLDPKVMEVLLQLVDAGGRVVSRTDLMAQVWKGLVVTDFALSRCIYQLRKNLFEASGSDDPSIETLPKRGYRLLWRVEDSVDTFPEQRSHPQTLRGLLPLAVLLVIAIAAWYWSGRSGLLPDSTAPARVVVLPFKDLSEDGSAQVFADGLTAEIVHALGQIERLTVVGRTSSRETDFTTASVLDYANRIGANYLLEGSVKGIGDSRRVLVRLQRMPEGEQLWSHAYMIEPGAPFTLVNQVVFSAVEGMQFVIKPGVVSGSTQNLDALESYLAAFEADSYESRKRLLERAVELDPKFARAWDALAGIEVMPVWNGQTTVEEAWERARPHVERALAIDPRLADAYVTLGRFEREFGDLDAAVERFRYALELEPGNVWASGNLGLVLRFTGQYREALAVHELDVLEDPISPSIQARLGTSNWFVENHDEAEIRYRLASELNPSYEETYDSWAAMLALGRGRLDKALDVINRKIAIEGQPTVRTYRAAAAWSRALGMVAEAEEYDRLAGQNPAGDPAYHLAHSDPGRARDAALGVLSGSPGDPRALLVLASLEDRQEASLDFAERVFNAIPDASDGPLYPHTPELEKATVYALACIRGGRPETGFAMLQQVIEKLPEPLSPQHFYVAAAHAMLGNEERALAELRASPPGWIRVNSAFLPHDARFANLWDHPRFVKMMRDHQLEISRQRERYMEHLTADFGD